MTLRALARRTVAATAILALLPAFGAGGTCFMDMRAAPPPHDCCKKTGLTAAPPSCCTSAQATVAAVSPHRAPRALACPGVQGLEVGFAARSVAWPRAAAGAAVALSPPLRLRI